ncbi:MAG: MBL fold metallo-hydrolase [Acidobacteria bacterium]|nr:MBL fold metallo-hydrolase [Acidobacteriota bacterium]
MTKRPSHHTATGFRNPPGAPHQTRSLKEFGPFFWRRLRESKKAVDVPEGHVLPVKDALEALHAAGRHDSLTWLGHASFLVRLSGMTLLTDPYLTDYASPVKGTGPKRYVPPGIPIAKLPKLDAILLSHNHYDHLDARAMRQIPDREDLLTIVPLKLGKALRRLGFHNVIELDWWDEAPAPGDLVVTGLPAIHFSARTLFDRDRTLWCGFGVRSKKHNLYFSGDTGYFEPTFQEIGRRTGPYDTAIVPIGAYDPRPIMRSVHASPEEGVQIGTDLSAKRLVGMHWGTVVLTDEPPFEPPQRFREAAKDSGYASRDTWVMKIGETRTL